MRVAEFDVEEPFGVLLVGLLFHELANGDDCGVLATESVVAAPSGALVAGLLFNEEDSLLKELLGALIDGEESAGESISDSRSAGMFSRGVEPVGKELFDALFREEQFAGGPILGSVSAGLVFHREESAAGAILGSLSAGLLFHGEESVAEKLLGSLWAGLRFHGVESVMEELLEETSARLLFHELANLAVFGVLVEESLALCGREPPVTGSTGLSLETGLGRSLHEFSPVLAASFFVDDNSVGSTDLADGPVEPLSARFVVEADCEEESTFLDAVALRSPALAADFLFNKLAKADEFLLAVLEDLSVGESTEGSLVDSSAPTEGPPGVFVFAKDFVLGVPEDDSAPELRLVVLFPSVDDVERGGFPTVESSKLKDSIGPSFVSFGSSDKG